eukprot:393846_1
MYDTLLIIWNRLSSIGSEDFVLGIEIISGDKLGEVVFMEDKQFDVLITERLGDKKIYIDIIGYENGMLEYLIGKLNIRYNIDNINTLLFISCYIYGLNDGDTGRDEECREESRELFYMLWNVLYFRNLLYYMLWSVISIVLFIIPTLGEEKIAALVGEREEESIKGRVYYAKENQIYVLIVERLGAKKISMDIEFKAGSLFIGLNIESDDKTVTEGKVIYVYFMVILVIAIETMLLFIYGMINKIKFCVYGTDDERDIYILTEQGDRKGYGELIDLGENSKLPIDNSVRPGVPKTLGKVKGEREGVRKWFAVLYDMLWHVLYVMVYYYLEYYVQIFIVELVTIRNGYDNIVVSTSDMYVMG